MSQAEILEQLVSLWQQRQREGRAVSPEELCADHPECLGELKRRVEALNSIEGFLSPPVAGESTVDDDRSGLARTMSVCPAPTGTPSAFETLQLGPGGYEILGELGCGGMGVVYRARQVGLNRVVALKMIRREGRGGDEARARFRREAEAVAQLKHPNIVPVYAWGEHEGQPFFALEYIDGGSLADRLDGKPWEPRRAAGLVASLAAAVQHAHEHGILHRDLKPHNVLLDHDGVPHLTDFGLARPLSDFGSNPGEALTLAGGILGTPAYMAPEQARGQQEELTAAVDVFGLGAILYQLLTGRTLHAGKNAQEVLRQAGQGAVTPVRQINPQVPAALARVCEQALAADPARRQPSAAKLEADLRRYLDRPKRIAIGGGLAVAALLVGALAVVLLARPTPEPSPADAGSPAPPPVVARPLAAELRVRIWSRLTRDRGLVQQSGVAPVRNGESVQVEARLNQPAYAYLLWLDSEGNVTPLYPWNTGEEIIVEDLDAMPLVEKPQAVVRSPSALSKGWPMEGPRGLETVLLLARREPLPADVKLSVLVPGLQPAPFDNPKEVVVRGRDRGQKVPDEVSLFRRPAKKAREVDESLLKLMEKLDPHFETIRAVRFAHEE
jgi:predicted Ser/Thr protein kinase